MDSVRCDRCGAMAYMKVTLDSGLILEFCNHHAREVEAKFRPDQMENREMVAA